MDPRYEFDGTNLFLLVNGERIAKRGHLSWTLANFRTGKCAKCPRIRGAREYLIGPGRAQNRKKIRGTSETPAKSPFPGPENWPKSSLGVDSHLL